MAANDHLSGAQFKTSTRRNSNGIRATTIRAYESGRNTGYAKVTEGGTFLDTVSVRPEARGRGLGHQLVGQVTDKFGDRTLRLHASPFGKDPGPDADALQSFYSKHGFEPEEGSSGYMVRRPR